jgi:hypothetical protein
MSLKAYFPFPRSHFVSPGSITSLVFPTRSHLLSASEDATLSLFRTRDWSLLRSFKGHTGRINSVAVHPTGKVALSVGVDRTLRMWDLMKGKAAGSTKIHKGSLAFALLLLLYKHCVLMSSFLVLLRFVCVRSFVHCTLQRARSSASPPPEPTSPSSLRPPSTSSRSICSSSPLSPTPNASMTSTSSPSLLPLPRQDRRTEKARRGSCCLLRLRRDR